MDNKSDQPLVGIIMGSQSDWSPVDQLQRTGQRPGGRELLKLARGQVRAKCGIQGIPAPEHRG